MTRYMSARFQYDLLGPLKARGRSWERSGRKPDLKELGDDDKGVHPCVLLLCVGMLLAVLLAAARELVAVVTSAPSAHGDEL